MRNLHICLKSLAQKVSGRVDGDLESLPSDLLCDDFESLDVGQKNKAAVWL